MIEGVVCQNEVDDSAESNTEPAASSPDGFTSATEDSDSSQADSVGGTASGSGKDPTVAVSETDTSVHDSAKEALCADAFALDMLCYVHGCQ